MNIHDLADVVEDLEAVNKLATLLRMVEAWNDICLELILDPEVTLEVQVEELEELLLQLLSRAAFCEREILIIGELAEVLGQDVFKIVEHLI